MSLQDVIIRPYQVADEAQVIALWHQCNLVVPWNDPQRDIALKLQCQPELFFVGALDTRIVATLMAGYGGHRGWFNYLAVAPDCQRQGIGRQIVAVAERALMALDCPKINLQVRAYNTEVIAFYERLGYQVEELISLGKRID